MELKELFNILWHRQPRWKTGRENKSHKEWGGLKCILRFKEKRQRDKERQYSKKNSWEFCVIDKRLKEKTMAPHSSTLAWRIPWMEEPGGLQSMGSLRVGHNWATSLSLITFMHWTRKWQPTPVFLPGESQGRGSLVGYRLWGRTESDTTEAT